MTDGAWKQNEFKQSDKVGWDCILWMYFFSFMYEYKLSSGDELKICQKETLEWEVFFGVA